MRSGLRSVQLAAAATAAASSRYSVLEPRGRLTATIVSASCALASELNGGSPVVESGISCRLVNNGVMDLFSPGRTPALLGKYVDGYQSALRHFA